MATALEATSELCAQLDAATCRIEIKRANAQRKLRSLIECHKFNLESVHSTYAAQAAEKEGCASMLLRLQEETELTNQVHAEELASLQDTITDMRAQLADTDSLRVTVRRRV